MYTLDLFTISRMILILFSILILFYPNCIIFMFSPYPSPSSNPLITMSNLNFFFVFGKKNFFCDENF